MFHTSKLFLIVFLFLDTSNACANTLDMMGYWSYPKSVQNQKFVSLYPIPGSLNEQNEDVSNTDMQNKLDYLTILAYAFMGVDHNGVIHFNNSHIDLSSQDKIFCLNNKEICIDNNGLYDPKLGNFTAFSRLQNHSGNLKKVVSIFSASGSSDFDNAINHIPAFVNSAATIVNHYHLNGINLDFEPDTINSAEEQHYADLISALRKTLGPKALVIITIDPDQTIKRSSWKSINNNVNFVSDMCYEFHAPFHPPYITGYNSNLYPDSNEPMANHYYHMSCDQSIKSLAFLGISPQKIMLGYPSYGITYGGISDNNNGLFQAFNKAETPNFDPNFKSAGRIRYRTILTLLSNGFREYATYSNGHISGVWAYNSLTHQFIAYDNPMLVHEKTVYAKENHLGGLMTWEINDDAPVTSPESLLKATSNTQ